MKAECASQTSLMAPTTTNLRPTCHEYKQKTTLQCSTSFAVTLVIVLIVGNNNASALTPPDGRDSSISDVPYYVVPTPQTTRVVYSEGNSDAGQLDSEPSTRDKKWTGPENRSQARVLYNYLITRGAGTDLFGKRMGSPTRNFRFFTSDLLGNTGTFHGSEFLGKRGNLGLHELNAPVSEFLGKRSGNPNYMEKRSKVSEFLGKRARVSEFLGKRARVSEFLGKRNGLSNDEEYELPSENDIEKRARVSEFLGKRNEIPENLKKRARVSEFLGKRARISEFLGKRYNFFKGIDRSPSRARVSEFLGKRSGYKSFNAGPIHNLAGSNEENYMYNDPSEDEATEFGVLDDQ